MCPLATSSLPNQKGNRQDWMKRWAFMLSYSNIILFSCHFCHCHLSICPVLFLFSLPFTLTHTITITIYFFTCSNTQYSISTYPLGMSFLSCPFAPPHSPNHQGQSGQTMPLVSARIANTIGDHHLGLLGNGLTINFQLKQTKEMTAQALWKMSRICINIRQVSIIVSSPLHQ